VDDVDGKAGGGEEEKGGWRRGRSGLVSWAIPFVSILTPQYHFPKLRGKQSHRATEKYFGLVNAGELLRFGKLKARIVFTQSLEATGGFVLASFYTLAIQ
jgi:hypothetical protein